jgi:hypothetical protein
MIIIISFMANMTETDLSTIRHPKFFAGLSLENMRLALLEDFLSLKTHEEIDQIYFSNLIQDHIHNSYNMRCSRLPFYNV